MTDRFLSLVFATFIIMQNINSQELVLTANVGHSYQVNCLKFSPDQKYLASGGNDGTVKIWEISSGKIVRSITDGSTSGIYNIYFDSEGKHISTFSEDTVRKWQISTGKRITNTSYANWRAVFSADSKYIAAETDDNKIKLLNNTGKDISTINKPFSSSNCSAVSTDGKFLAFIYNNSIIISDTQSGKEIKTYTANSEQVYDVAFSYDGNYMVAVGPGETIDIWDLKTGTEMKSLKSTHTETPITVSFSPDGNYLATGYDFGSISLWDLNSEKEILILKGEGSLQFSSVEQSASGNQIFITNEEAGSSIIYDLQNIKNSKKYPNQYITNLVDNYFVSRENETMNLYETKTGKWIRKIDQDWKLSPDGKYGAYATQNNEIKIQLISTGKDFLTLKGHTSEINHLVYSLDGKFLISSDRENILMWNTQTGEKVITIADEFIDAVALSPKNQYIFLLSSSMTQYESNLIKIFDAKSGKRIREYYSLFYSVENIMSADENYFLGISMYDIEILDTKTGNPIRVIHTNDAPLFGASFLSGGKYIVSMSEGGTIKFWETATGKLLVTQKFQIDFETKQADYLIFTPDGRFDGTENGMKLLHYVKGWEIMPLASLFEQFYTPNLLARVLSGEKLEEIEINIAEIKLPPLVKITSPNQNIRGFTPSNNVLQSEQETIDVTVQATDMGGGIDEIALYLNGKLVQTTNRGYKVVPKDKEIKTQTFSISLSPGENKIKATAFSNQRTESVPAEITVNYQGSKSSADLYMLVIGIDNYKNPKYKLNYALADASGFKSSIEKGSQGIFGKREIIYLSDAQASKEGIVKAFATLKTNAKASDVFILYYAGHGVMSEEQKSEFFIVPFDVTQLYGNNEQLRDKGISAKELQEFSKEIKAQKQLFVFDACQSGGMVEHLANRGAAEEKAIAQLARSTGTYWLAASSSEQFATEFSELGHGLFTYTILQALKGEADGSNKDKKITVKEISSYLNDMVPELSTKYKGTAQYPNSYGYGMDFPLVIVK